MRICSAVSSDLRTSMVSAPRLSRIPRRISLTVSLASVMATIVSGRLKHALHRDAAKLPVAVVTGDQDDAASLGAIGRRAAAYSGAYSNQWPRISLVDAPSARRKSMTSRAYARSVSSARRSPLPDGVRPGDSGQVVGERFARRSHQAPRQPGADVDRCTTESGAAGPPTPRKVSAENDAVVQTVQGPFARDLHGAVATPASRTSARSAQRRSRNR